MKLLKRLVFGKKSDSENYIRHLRKIGVLVGDKCQIFSPLRTVIDEQNSKPIFDSFESFLEFCGIKGDS